MGWASNQAVHREVSEKLQRSLAGDRKRRFYSEAVSLSLASTHSGLLETTVPRMPYSYFRDWVGRTSEVVEKAEAPESDRLPGLLKVLRRHGEATTPEG